MDKLTERAFHKMQMAEHLTRFTNDLFQQGKINRETHSQRMAAINKQYALTAAEQKAYEAWERKRKAK